MHRLVVALLGLLSLIAPQVAAQQAYAHAVLHPFFNSSNANTATPIQGTVDFMQNDDGTGFVTVTVKVQGLQANKNYSIHVHQWGNMDGYVNLTTGMVPTNTSTLPAVGGHFNPFNVSHGCGYGNIRHEGDIGNVSIPDGTDPATWTTVVLYSELLDLGRDKIMNNSIIGRTVAIHEMADPCTPDIPLGAWVAIGVIGINNIVANNNATSEPIVPDGQGAPKATAIIFNITDQLPSGEINFWTDALNRIHMQGYLTGFKPFSEHGIHIHQFGNEDSNTTIGAHFGPSSTHALPPNPNRHWGDLGNVVADANGDIIFSDYWAGLNLISIQNPMNSILGRAIAIHEMGDNGTPTSYGNRYNFGVIGLAAPDFVPPSLPAPVYPSVARAQVILRPFYFNISATWPDAPLAGNITFSQNVDGTGNVNITIMVAGLRGNASYGLHVHQYGNELKSFDPMTGAPLTTKRNLGNATVDGIGGHLNPFLQTHGCAPGPRHEGDIGNITVQSLTDSDRYTFFTYNLTSDLLDLGRDQIGNNSIIGRTVTLHDAPNPCDPNAALGNWIAIGVIGIDTSRIAVANLKEQNVASQDDNLPANDDNNSPKANAVIRDFRSGQIVGDLFFWRGYQNEIRMTGAVVGFAPNSSHGVHIHQFGNENDNTTIGPHWAVAGQDGNDFHALAPYAGRHYGDMIGNATADANGVITFTNYSFGFDLLSLTSAANSIIGHSIAFHERLDDGTAASYGPRYRFGVIGMAHPDFPIPTIAPLNIPTSGPSSSSSSSSSTGTGGSANSSSSSSSSGSTGGSTMSSSSSSSSEASGNATTAPPTPTPTSQPPSTASTISSSFLVTLVVALLATLL